MTSWHARYPTPQAAFWRCNPPCPPSSRQAASSHTNPRGSLSSQALMSHLTAGTTHAQHPAFTPLLLRVPRDSPLHIHTHGNQRPSPVRGWRRSFNVLSVSKSRQCCKASALSRLGKRQFLPAVLVIIAWHIHLKAKPQ